MNKEEANKEKGYDINFFRPHNAFAKKNNTIIVTMLIIWAVAVFGFQFLLRALEKPVPEKTLGIYQTAAGKIEAGTPTVEDKKSYAKSLLMVLGKSLKPGHRTVLQGNMTKMVFDTADSGVKNTLLNDLIKMQIISLTVDEGAYNSKASQYADLKSRIINSVSTVTGYKAEHVCSQISPYHLTLNILDLIDQNKFNELIKGLAEADRVNLSKALKNYSIITKASVLGIIRKLPAEQQKGIQSLWDNSSASGDVLSESFVDDEKIVAEIMELYLTHYRSVLTDTVFLGFPFNYWYTAEFLLILFVSLCLIYCKLLDKMHAKKPEQAEATE